MSEENNQPLVENNTPEAIMEPVVVEEPIVIEEPVFVPEPVVVTEPVLVEEPAPTISEAEANNVITAPSFAVSEVPAVGIVQNGVIGSTTKKIETVSRKSDKKHAPKEETVAIYSTKNVTWPEVGKVYRGYNIVAKSAADKWLTRSHVRLATPEEVAKEFGK